MSDAVEELMITAEDARMWGREAHGMGLSLERAISDITDCGCPARLIAHVVAGWEASQHAARNEQS